MDRRSRCVAADVPADVSQPVRSAQPLSVFVGTWNLEGRPISSLDDINDWLLYETAESGSLQAADIVAVGFQEVVAGAGASLLKWFGDKLEELGMGENEAQADEVDDCVLQSLKTTGPYVKIASVDMVGLYLVCFAKASLAPHICELDTDRIRSNAEGLAGKKGGVALRFSVLGSSLCFVNVHFPSGDKNVEARSWCLRRVVAEAFQGVNMEGGRRPPKLNYKRESRYMLQSHTATFMFGDFNFRLDIHESQLTKGVAGIIEADFPHLLLYDQYRFMSKTDKIVRALTEAPVNFPPTYKYVVGTTYFDENRIPAWTDRIFQYGSSAPQRQYKAHMRLCQTSDHRPVSGVFVVPLESRSPTSVHTRSPASIHSQSPSSAYAGYPSSADASTHSQPPSSSHGGYPSSADTGMHNAAMCRNGCGRPRYRHFPTCCTRCSGRNGPHAGDCLAKATHGRTGGEHLGELSAENSNRTIV